MSLFWQAACELDPAADDESGLAGVREQCRRKLPAGPFEVSATAWAATGRA